MHRIAVLSSTRADYGLLYWLLREIDSADDLELLLYVTGAHLSPEFGLTVTEIERDGFAIHRRIEILLSSDTSLAAAKSMGLAMHSMGECLADDRPAALILLGDRYEIVPAALCAVLHGIPVVHLHGGETSEGAIDEYFRHAVTKLSSLHFPATETYRRRIIQMGEDPNRVHNVGAPGLDHLHRSTLLSKAELSADLGIDLDRPTAIATFHPVTTESGAAVDQVDTLLSALEHHDGLQVVLTRANADAEGRAINSRLEHWCTRLEGRFHLYDNLGARRYLSCLQHFDIMVGNSSSGLIEAPAFRLPVVNIGNRQRGRVAARNVIPVTHDYDSIRQALDLGLSASFRESLADMTNPYDALGDGRVSTRIVEKLRHFLRSPPGRTKPFVDQGNDCTGT